MPWPTAAKPRGVLAKGEEAANAAARLTEVTAIEGKNTVTWTVDANGQTVKAHGDFKEVFDGAKRSSAENEASSAMGKTGDVDDVGGHIAAHRFMKDQGPVNMFPQNTRFNNSAYKTMENEWGRLGEAGQGSGGADRAEGRHRLAAGPRRRELCGHRPQDRRDRARARQAFHQRRGADLRPGAHQGHGQRQAAGRQRHRPAAEHPAR